MCEPAGPGFDGTSLDPDPKKGFRQVQCVHTNMGGFGTTDLNCDQDWRMGICGEHQIGARLDLP